jgi:transposase InsO family protein
MIQTQFNASIKIVRSDNGGKYLSSSPSTFLRDHGIIHQTTCVNTPQQNGAAKQRNQHLLEVTQSLMIDMHGPKSNWGDALLATTYLINWMPSCVTDFKTHRLHLYLLLKVSFQRCLVVSILFTFMVRLGVN